MNERIPKLILKYDEIKQDRLWGFQPTECYQCKGHLFYFAEEKGIVYEKSDYGIYGYVFDKGSLSLRTVGIKAYCAECGTGNDSYTSWHYFKDDVVYVFSDGLDHDDEYGIEAYLTIVNKTGKAEISQKQKQAYGLFVNYEALEALKKWFPKHQNLLIKNKKVKIKLVKKKK